MRDRISETVFRNINCAAHIMLCMVLTALLLAGNAAFVHAGEAEIVCVMERTGDGKLGMRIDAGKNSGIDAYDLDVVYDPQSVRPVEAEARGGEPTAFAYQDINDTGVFRIVGLMQEPLTKAGAFLYIKWEPLSKDDIQYVPTLTVRDLADSEGEDLSYGISYTGVDGGAVTPSPAKSTESDSANGGSSQETDRTDEAAPVGDADDGNGSGARGNGDVAETPASNDTTNTNGEAADVDAAGQAGKNRVNQNVTKAPDNSRAARDESGGQRKDDSGDLSSEDSLADDKDAGSTDRTDSQAEDSYGTENSAPNATPEVLAEDAVEQEADGNPDSTNGAAVIIVLILAAVLGGVYYYNKKTHHT